MKRPLCCEVPMVFLCIAVNCGTIPTVLVCLGSCLLVAALGSVSVEMKIERRVRYANFVGGPAAPLEGAQCQVHVLEGHKQLVECQKAVIDGDWPPNAISFVLSRRLWRQQWSKKSCSSFVKGGY